MATMKVTYDPGVDVLRINFKKPSHATDSELTDEDVIGLLLVADRFLL